MPGLWRIDLRPQNRNMLGMKTGLLFLVIGGLFGTGAGLMLASPIEVVEAAEYLPVPGVFATCDEWVIQETGPDFYWDGPSTEHQTSTADYWTVKTVKNGVTVQSESAGQGESITVPPSDDGSVVVSWYDSDRPSKHQRLSEVAVMVPGC